MHRPVLLLLAALVGSACAARTHAIDAQLMLAAGLAAAPVCEAYAATQCPNRCYVCTRLDGFKICVPKNVAEKLAPMVFECVHAHNGEPEPDTKAAAALSSGGVPVPCDTFDANECQSHTNECALCTSPMEPEGRCYTPEQARDLPQIMFKCRWPELA